MLNFRIIVWLVFEEKRGTRQTESLIYRANLLKSMGPKGRAFQETKIENPRSMISIFSCSAISTKWTKPGKSVGL